MIEHKKQGKFKKFWQEYLVLRRTEKLPDFYTSNNGLDKESKMRSKLIKLDENFDFNGRYKDMEIDVLKVSENLERMVGEDPQSIRNRFDMEPQNQKTLEKIVRVADPYQPKNGSATNKVIFEILKLVDQKTIAFNGTKRRKNKERLVYSHPASARRAFSSLTSKHLGDRDKEFMILALKLIFMNHDRGEIYSKTGSGRYMKNVAERDIFNMLYGFTDEIKRLRRNILNQSKQNKKLAQHPTPRSEREYIISMTEKALRLQEISVIELSAHPTETDRNYLKSIYTLEHQYRLPTEKERNLYNLFSEDSSGKKTLNGEREFNFLRTMARIIGKHGDICHNLWDLPNITEENEEKMSIEWRTDFFAKGFIAYLAGYNLMNKIKEEYPDMIGKGKKYNFLANTFKTFSQGVFHFTYDRMLDVCNYIVNQNRVSDDFLETLVNDLVRIDIEEGYFRRTRVRKNQISEPYKRFHGAWDRLKERLGPESEKKEWTNENYLERLLLYSSLNEYIRCAEMGTEIKKYDGTVVQKGELQKLFDPFVRD